jgi:phospholipid/cholesterol/gamma-HCH transport system substrate-binding protein
LLCGALLGAGGTSQQCRDALDPLLGLLGLSEDGGR